MVSDPREMPRRVSWKKAGTQQRLSAQGSRLGMGNVCSYSLILSIATHSIRQVFTSLKHLEEELKYKPFYSQESLLLLCKFTDEQTYFGEGHYLTLSTILCTHTLAMKAVKQQILCILFHTSK